MTLDDLLLVDTKVLWDEAMKAVLQAFDEGLIGRKQVGPRLFVFEFVKRARPAPAWMLDEHDEGDQDEVVHADACPGCGCRPGDGATPGCTHPLGCGFTG